MGAINVKKFGLAVGLTLLFLRLGCMIVIATMSREQAVVFFNTLVHGIDINPILRTEMSVVEMAYGLIQIFILGWLAGASIASIYNLQCIKCEAKSNR